MIYMYKFGKLPNDKKLLQKIDLAAGRLLNKLRNLDPTKLSLSESMTGFINEKLE